MVTELLRAGASLDVSHGDYAPSKTAEDVLQRRESYTPNLARTRTGSRAKRLVAGVRQHGSYNARSFHRDVLTVRGLAQRGKLRTDDPVLQFLARLGDNGVCWHIPQCSGARRTNNKSKLTSSCRRRTTRPQSTIDGVVVVEPNGGGLLLPVPTDQHAVRAHSIT